MDYRYDPEALKQIAAGHNAAAASMDTGLAVKIPSADAGISSEIVGLTVANLILIGITLAQVVEDIGEQVDATDGSYAEVENSNEGEMVFMEKYHLMGYRGPVGPLDQAPARTTEATP